MRILLCVICFAIALSCGYHSYNEREIIGQWFSQEWLQEGYPTNMRAWMEFNADSTYRAVFVDNQEQGRYWIDGYKLYTQAEGAELITVKIESIKDDTLHISMNRGGDREEIIFSRARQ